MCLIKTQLSDLPRIEEAKIISVPVKKSSFKLTPIQTQ